MARVEFDFCLSKRPGKIETTNPKTPERRSVIGEIDMTASMQYIVNPPAKLPAGFKFGPVFV